MSARPRIVCAVEGRESSRHAVDASRWLADELGAAIVVVHAFDEWDVGVPAVGELAARSVTTDAVVGASRQAAAAMLQEVSDSLAGADHTVELVDAAPVPGVLGVVREQEAELLVTGTAARGTVDRILLGSVAAELAAKSPCPVAVVPPGAPIGRPGPVLVAHDASEHSHRAAREGAALADRMGRELVVLHATDHGDDADSELENVEVVSTDSDVVEALVRAADRHDAALVVAGTRGRGPLTAALLGSVSAGLVRSSGRPVVLVSADAAQL